MLEVFTWIPSQGSDIEVTPRLRQARFRDSVEQSEPDGINSLPKSLRLVFSRIRPSEAQEIIEFLERHQGTKTFKFHVPEPYDVDANFHCASWDRTLDAPNSETIIAEFSETNNPA